MPPKFNTFGLFIPILGTSAIMDQTACCYNVTTSETGLFEQNCQNTTAKKAINKDKDGFLVERANICKIGSKTKKKPTF